jgi:hypothetical protein
MTGKDSDCARVELKTDITLNPSLLAEWGVANIKYL